MRPSTGNHRAATRRVLLLLAASLPAAAAMADSWVSDATGSAGDLFGAAVSELDDVNSDGRSEFLVGAPGALTDDGEVFLWYGGTGMPVTPHLAWTGASNEYFGWALARIGDVNDDGADDFAVGAPLADNTGLDAGRVYVFYGENLVGGTAATRAAVIINGENAGDRFGWSISAAGDMDGDGRDDFIVGAPRNDSAGLDAGAAYIVYGASSGPSASLAAATKLTGEIAGDNFGWSVCDAGNFLTGNEDCVAVGAPLNNTHGGMAAGAVYVYRGGLGNVNPDAMADLVAGIGSSSRASAQYGYCVRNAGRWDGDSWDDLAIGAPFCDEQATDAGRVEIIFGGASPATSGDRSVDGENAGDNLGWSLARARDWAGTSAEDLLIGAPGSNTGGADAGRAYVYRGGQADVGTAAAIDALPNLPVMAGTGPGDLYGQAVSSLGDVDGDGQMDIAVAGPAGNSYPSNATGGFVHLRHSGSAPVGAELRTWQARWLADDEVGQVALSFALTASNGDFARIDLTRLVYDAQGQRLARDLLWSAPAVVGTPAVGELGVSDGSYRFTDPGPALPPQGGAIAYEVAALTSDGRTSALGEREGPTGTAPTFGLAFGAMANPFSARVAFSFRARNGDPVQVSVFDVRGRLVRHLHDGVGSGTWVPAVWDGRDTSGRLVADGVYLLTAHSREGLRSRRLTLVR
ncbi:MAG: FG-GAP repeat protein [bacterium]|nr:FG-GAP repeat protein [bacterium]